MGNEMGTQPEDERLGEFFKALLVENAEQRRRQEAITAAVLLAALSELRVDNDSDDDNEPTTENLPPGFSESDDCKWDPKDRSPNIKLSNNGKTAKKVPRTASKTTDLVRAVDGYTEGIHIFKIFSPKASRGNISCVIGLSTTKTPRQCDGHRALLGGQETSLGWDIVSQQALYNGSIISRYPENKPNFQVPEIFMMVVDLNRGSLIFKSEDEDYGVCLSGLDEVFSDKGIRLYPAVSMTVPDCELSISKAPVAISPERRKIGLEKLLPAWGEVNVLMKKENLEECNTVINLLTCFVDVVQKSIDNVPVRDVVLQIIVAFDNCATLIKYLNFLWKNIKVSGVVKHFSFMTVALLSLTNRNVYVPLAFKSSNSFVILATILTEIPSSCLNNEAKIDNLGCLLGTVYNCSRVVEVRQTIVNGPMMKVLRTNLKETESIPLRYVSAAMSLGNILTDEERKSFEIGDLILKQILRMIKCGANGEMIACNGSTFILEEILETTHAFMDCQKNCWDFIQNYLISHLIKILQKQDDARVVELALGCLNKALTRILGSIRNPGRSNADSLMKYVKVDGIAEILQKKKNVKSESYSAVAETCLIKLSEILKKKSQEKCILRNICKEYVRDELRINASVFNDKYEMCYCQVCHVQRNDNEHYNRGDPPRRYALPIGWYRLGVATPPPVRATNAFQNWYRAYYKLTNTRNLCNTLKQGGLVMPGQKNSEGQVVPIETEGQKRILLSPTIRYCDYYTKASKWKNYEVKAALQILVEPNTFKTQKGTSDETKILDPLFANEEIEWSIDRQGTTFVYGLLLKITENK